MANKWRKEEYHRYLSRMKSFLSMAGLSAPNSACVARRTLFMSVKVPINTRKQDTPKELASDIPIKAVNQQNRSS